MGKLNLAEKTEKNLKIIASIIGSVVIIFGAVQWSIGFAMSGITTKLDSIEASTTRTELLLMMADHPDDVKSITYLAEKYFIDLKQDSYVFSIYRKWANAHDIDIADIKTAHELNSKN
jgi:hypothetical protein